MSTGARAGARRRCRWPRAPPERERLERAASLVEAAPRVAAGDRPAPTRRSVPISLDASSLTRPASANSSSSGIPATSAHVSPSVEATRPGAASSRSAPTSAASTGAGEPRPPLGRSTTIAATRSARPNGSSRRLSSGPGELALDDGGQHVAGQPALGVAGDAAAQQLERDDRHRLVERKAVEVRQRPAVLDRDQPRLEDPLHAQSGPGRPSVATGSARARLPPRSSSVGRPERRAAASVRAAHAGAWPPSPA